MGDFQSFAFELAGSLTEGGCLQTELRTAIIISAGLFDVTRQPASNCGGLRVRYGNLRTKRNVLNFITRVALIFFLVSKDSFVNVVPILVCISDLKNWETRTGVVVLSYSRYCRYRALLRRLEGVHNDWLRDELITALGGFATTYHTTKILFCRDTFDYPELEGHELLCNHLGIERSWNNCT